MNFYGLISSVSSLFFVAFWTLLLIFASLMIFMVLVVFLPEVDWICPIIVGKFDERCHTNIKLFPEQGINS